MNAKIGESITLTRHLAVDNIEDPILKSVAEILYAPLTLYQKLIINLVSIPTSSEIDVVRIMGQLSKGEGLNKLRGLFKDVGDIDVGLVYSHFFHTSVSISKIQQNCFGQSVLLVDKNLSRTRRIGLDPRSIDRGLLLDDVSFMVDPLWGCIIFTDTGSYFRSSPIHRLTYSCPTPHTIHLKLQMSSTLGWTVLAEGDVDSSEEGGLFECLRTAKQCSCDGDIYLKLPQIPFSMISVEHGTNRCRALIMTDQVIMVSVSGEESETHVVDSLGPNLSRAYLVDGMIVAVFGDNEAFCIKPNRIRVKDEAVVNIYTLEGVKIETLPQPQRGGWLWGNTNVEPIWDKSRIVCREPHDPKSVEVTTDTFPCMMRCVPFEKTLEMSIRDGGMTHYITGMEFGDVIIIPQRAEFEPRD